MPSLLLILPVVISFFGTMFSVIFVWFYTRRVRTVTVAQTETQTVESAVNAIATIAKARLDEIELLKANNAELLRQMAAQKVDYETRLAALERKVDDLEVRNSSLRRRVDRYEMQDEKD